MRKKFIGWYFKCQSDTQTLAIVLAKHGGSRSVQVITENSARNFTKNIKCRYSFRRLTLDLHEKGVRVKGSVMFDDLTPIAYDIMGPFKFVPFLQCRHSVVSMHHRVNGRFFINETEYVFCHADGYIEGDRGTSFPSQYAWTQTFFDGGSLMVSTADIPFAGFHFTGVIGVIHWRGTEYRLATYLGARAVKKRNGELVIRQGKTVFTARLIRKNAKPLAAPVRGEMSRTIHESAACRAAYRLEKDGKTLFDFETDKASFEFEYGEVK